MVEGTGRVSVHGVPIALVGAQAAAAGVELATFAIPWPCPNAIYEERLAAALRAHAVAEVAFGDLFLQDIRAYREGLAVRLGFEASFPVWRRDTDRLARELLAAGFEATVVAVDEARLDRSFVGRAYDEALLADLPPGVDPCGENGELHTFVHAGPVFVGPVPSP